MIADMACEVVGRELDLPMTGTKAIVAIGADGKDADKDPVINVIKLGGGLTKACYCVLCHDIITMPLCLLHSIPIITLRPLNSDPRPLSECHRRHATFPPATHC